jgi:hypothetical protein
MTKPARMPAGAPAKDSGVADVSEALSSHWQGSHMPLARLCADANDIRKTIDFLHKDNGGRFEIRAAGVLGADGRRRTKFRVFNAHEKAEAVRYAVWLNDHGAEGVWITINPVSAAHPSTKAAGDQDITRRKWIPVDCDSIRPAKTSATEAETKAARSRAIPIATELIKQHGFPSMLFANSGNGAHLFIPTDLPNDSASTDLVERFLHALDRGYSDDAVKIDCAVANASRVFKLYGTVTRKGPHTAERPHRRSNVLLMPTDEERAFRPGPVTAAMLEAVIAAFPSAASASPSAPSNSSANNQSGRERRLRVRAPDNLMAGGGFSTCVPAFCRPASQADQRRMPRWH